MRPPAHYLPLATNDSIFPTSPSKPRFSASSWRRFISWRGFTALCIFLYVILSLWVLQSAAWHWLDNLDASAMQMSPWLSLFGIDIEHVNPPSGVYAPHVQMKIGPLGLLYRGRSRKLGLWRHRKTVLNAPISELATLPSVNSTSCPSDKNGPRLLVGIFTTAEKVHRRNMIRDLEGFDRYCTPEYGIECKFVVGQSYDARLHSQLILEMNKHQDIMLLRQGENMNEGKTYEFYKHVAQRSINRPHFVMKQDDDSFVHLPRMLEALAKLDCNQLTYFGMCWHPTCGQHLGLPFYFGGMAYGVSWPLLSWMTDKSVHIEDRSLHIAEDILTGRLIESMSDQDRKQVLFYSLDEQMGNYKSPVVPWEKQSVIVVHGMKEDDTYKDTAVFVTSRD